MPKLLGVYEYKNKPKRFYATFLNEENKIKRVGFGDVQGSTYIDHGDEKKRTNYIKRHSMNPLESPYLDKDKYYDMPANLSMFILWGPNENLKENIKAYKKRFNLE